MRYFLAWIGSLGRALAYWVTRWPVQRRDWFASCLAWIWWDFLRIRRDVVLDNIARVFPEMSSDERVALARRSLNNLGRTFIEYCELPFLNKGKLNQYFVFQGLDKLDAALKDGKGVCLVTLHLGNGDLAIAAMSLLGYPLHLLSKEFKIRWLNDFWFGMRARCGTRFISPRHSSVHVLRALKAGEVVVFVQDQFTGPPIGVRSHFFGIETGTAAGVGVMARRSGSEVLLAYTYRRDDGRHQLVFDEGVGSLLRQDSDTHLKKHHQEGRMILDKAALDKSLVEFVEVLNRRLERYILQHPDQWLWIHKRWKVFRDH